jgi:predicted ATPase
VRVLATSRQALRIAGEVTYRLPSLGVPAVANGELTANQTAHYAAMALFVDRARSVDHRFTLNDENVTAVAEICRRLDGIPLAIELAAARVKVLSPRQLHERLDERFRVLTTGSRDALPRQQTLRALIDWSYDQLSDRERILFRRLAVFVNGFALEGAVAVGGGDELEIVDVLSSLVDKSLVLSEDAGDSLRYRLLESTRVYAAEKLAEAGERDATARNHLLYLRDRFTGLREAAERTARSSGIDDAFATELEDVRTALDGAARTSDLRAAAELLAEIGWNWSRLGLGREGERRVEAALATLADREASLLARLSASFARMYADEGRAARAFDIATVAVAYARESADGPILAEALHVYSTCARQMRHFDVAEAALAEAAGIVGASTALRLRLLSARSSLDTQRGDFAAAAHRLEQLREEHRLLGNARSERIAALNLAEAEHARGQTHRAIAIVRDVLPGFAAQSDTTVHANVLANFAGYLAAIDDLPGAAAAARQAVDVLAAREPDGTYVASALEHLALTFALREDLAGAAVLSGYVDAAYARAGVAREKTETTTHERLATLLRERLDKHELARFLAEGEALTPESAVARGLAGA